MRYYDYYRDPDDDAAAMAREQHRRERQHRFEDSLRGTPWDTDPDAGYDPEPEPDDAPRRDCELVPAPCEPGAMSLPMCPKQDAAVALADEVF